MSPGEPTRRLNVVEAEEPPAPPTLWQRWDALPTSAQAACVVALLGALTGIYTALEMGLVHLRLSDAVPDAAGWTVLTLLVYGVAWLVIAGIKGELD